LGKDRQEKKRSKQYFCTTLCWFNDLPQNIDLIWNGQGTSRDEITNS
jgi:hypothetical protein